MRRLSKVIHFSKGRNLIVKLDQNFCPRLGQIVYDSKLREVGKVRDIFGPVSKPYISITPTIPDPESLVGKVVYLD
ncbi:MAG: H/ACA ribonucleoprotein complex subunit GAR1 [Candidatus Bathyarchaeia archaeon]